MYMSEMLKVAFAMAYFINAFIAYWVSKPLVLPLMVRFKIKFTKENLSWAFYMHRTVVVLCLCFALLSIELWG